MELFITRTQYSALSDIYGPPEKVHFMLMTSCPVDGGWLLRGSEESFNELLLVGVLYQKQCQSNDRGMQES